MCLQSECQEFYVEMFSISGTHIPVAMLMRIGAAVCAPESICMRSCHRSRRSYNLLETAIERYWVQSYHRCCTLEIYCFAVNYVVLILHYHVGITLMLMWRELSELNVLQVSEATSHNTHSQNGRAQGEQVTLDGAFKMFLTLLASHLGINWLQSLLPLLIPASC